MTKNFDDICKGILGEMIAAPAPQASASNQTQPAAGTGAAAAVQNNTQQNNQMKDDELLKMLQQKLQDQKFKQSLMQLLNPQQPNAAQPQA